MHGVSRIRREHGFPEIDALGPDLSRVRWWEVALSLAVPWICLAIYVFSALAGWWGVAVLGTVLLSFFTYGSISHDLVHSNLGLPRRLNSWLLTATELLAIRSGHAYQAAHLHHHARFPADDDMEGAAAGMGFVRTLVEGVVLQPRLWWWAVCRPSPMRGRIVAEGVAVVAVIVVSMAVIPWTVVPAVYVGLMVAGSWVIPLATSYIPHDKHAGEPLRNTRRFRGRLLSLIAVEHLYHLEHHLYPQVPHHRWALLARRLDPYLDRAGVTVIRLGRRKGAGRGG